MVKRKKIHRPWNKLRVRIKDKGTPNEHNNYEITIPSFLIEKSGWKKDDIIGFHKNIGTGGEKRCSFEMVNLTKENRKYADMTFIKLQQDTHSELLEFAKWFKSGNNFNNLSKDMQKVIIASIPKNLKKFKEEKNKKKRS
jgi:hypothetical protein